MCAAKANPQGGASISAEACDVPLLDCFACRGFEFDHIVAVSQEDGGDSKGGGSVRYRGAELSSVASVMHLPNHALSATRLGGCNTDLNQSPFGQAGAEVVKGAALKEPADDRSCWDPATSDFSVVEASCCPAGRYRAASHQSWAVLGVGSGDVLILKGQPYPGWAAGALGRHLDGAQIELPPYEKWVMQHRMRCPGQFGEVPHQLASAGLRSGGARQS